MAFDFTFNADVIELAQGVFSTPVEFSDSVPAEANELFLRLIALHDDNASFGGADPTILIRSGEQGFTELNVTRPGEPTHPVAIVGTGGIQVATATCVHEDGDIYLVAISDLAENNGPWKLRIRNNDQETLHFVAVSSTTLEQTAQPWMVWGAKLGSFATAGDPAERKFTLDLGVDHSVIVRNLGTGPLRFAASAGVRIGPPDSAAVIAALLTPAGPGAIPGQLDPHGVKTIVFGLNENGADDNATFPHTMETNDPNADHEVTLTISVKRTNFDAPPAGLTCQVDGCPGYLPPPPYIPANGATNTGACIQAGCGHNENVHRPRPLPGASCNIDHCPGYLPPPPFPPPPAGAAERCSQPGCGHGPRFHGLGPKCQEKDDPCPGFLDDTGRGRPDSGSAICVQPGCGHFFTTNHFPPKDVFKESLKETKEFKDKDHKDKEKDHPDLPLAALGDVSGTPTGKPMPEREEHGYGMPDPENSASQLTHFIEPGLRPDLSHNPLSFETDLEDADGSEKPSGA